MIGTLREGVSNILRYSSKNIFITFIVCTALSAIHLLGPLLSILGEQVILVHFEVAGGFFRHAQLALW